MPAVDPHELETDPNWICTDPDNGQWVKQLDTFTFRIYEEWADHVGVYNAGNKTLAELDEIVGGYYPCLNRVFDEYGSDWPQIIAEILSEKAAGEANPTATYDR